MFAVIKTGGKQYRVAANDTITIATLEGEAGSAVTFGDVLLFTDGDATQVGAPLLSGITVTGEIVGHGRDKKVIAFKKRRRQNSRRKRGHRQHHTVVRITEISAGGKSSKASERKAKAPKAEPAAAEA
ncbi:MAG: 50S ribosomal protein L21 [Methylobacterium sp. CG08_land_8_20_14_0_20_71_15]|uniref:Large ribosomal subunit protein bL21 n=1 Tax=Methylobacterium jeotgali TaxID=381630 RepID=A0ABQ4T0H7_9HYPH|nr:MAG: 50S ribosomal protein L21 [Methylobacterium sp. CG09_land_8_20_14_0_10_71_15]PIU11486.1 MAG: 50S ribosomal protein L21 [Methylobacterium sp. CG08_land_8_20_14_0_20_71_15]GBU16551.1 50S ribosomal protein L21 [Methylobacterium sp.]GJE07643.1 50S ribosomal protein L21 [Methylobacterium jeotgali]